jgi:uncharacterized protein (TIGR00106 family)
MLFELSLIPLGGDAHHSDEIAEALKIIESSGLPYQLAPMGTCIEGDWDAVLPVIRQCHARMREKSPHVITLLRIEDEEGARDKIRRNVTSVEEKLGHGTVPTVAI